MHRPSTLASCLVSLSLVFGAPAAAGAQTSKLSGWKVSDQADGTCTISAGYAPEEGSAGYRGLQLMKLPSHPRQVTLAVSFNPDETQDFDPVKNGTEVLLHLVFSNPDLGNGRIELPTELLLATNPAGASDLVGELGPEDVAFVRRYHTLDVYAGTNAERVRRFSLEGSGAALDRLAACARHAPRP